MRNSFYKALWSVAIIVAAFSVVQAEVLNLNGKNGQTITTGGTYDGIESTQGTVKVKFQGATLNLGSSGIRMRSEGSRLILENCTLGSTSAWTQYMKVGSPGGISQSDLYNTSQIVINGTLTINTDHTIILSRVIKGENNPTIVVNGTGKVILIPPSAGDTYAGIKLPEESEHFHVANQSLVISAK